METNKAQQNSANFDEYHRQMSEKREEERGRDVAPAPKRPLAVAFGIFMVIVFVGMGVLMIINYFGWAPGFDWMRWILGVAFCIYGVFRGYRMIKGDDYYTNK